MTIQLNASTYLAAFTEQHHFFQHGWLDRHQTGSWMYQPGNAAKVC